MPSTLSENLRALGGADDAAVIDFLIGVVPHDLSLDSDFVAALLPQLSHSNQEIRRRSADVLAHALARGVGVSITRACLDSSDPALRWGVAFAFSRAGCADESVFVAALGTLGAADGDLRWAACEMVCSLAPTYDPAFERIRACAAEPGAPAESLRKAALYCLRDLKADCSALFVTSLSDPSTAVRLAAMAALGRMPRRGVVLGEVDRLAVIEALRRCLAEDPDHGVRRTAAVTLGAWAQGDADLVAVLRDVEERSRAEDAQLAHAALMGLRRAGITS